MPSFKLNAVGAGPQSRFYPYVVTMPQQPSCGVMMSDDAAKKDMAKYFGEAQLDVHLSNLRAAEAAYKQVCSHAHILSSCRSAVLSEFCASSKCTRAVLQLLLNAKPLASNCRYGS